MALRIAWAGMALLAFGLVLTLVRFWGASSEYADRFLIPLASVWLFHKQWPAWRALPVRPFRAAYVPMLAFLVLMPPAAYLVVSVGSQHTLLWAVTGSVLGVLSCLILAQGGWPRLRPVLFPIIFVLFSLPLPGRFDNDLQQRLKVAATHAAEWGLTLCGIPVTRYEFELHLPSGGLQVVEACSGVRSLTALTAIAVFVAHVRGFGLVRGLVLLVLALPVVGLCNGIRITVTGLLQEYVGAWAAQGTPHEILGGAMVLVGLSMIVGISGLMLPRHPAVGPVVQGEPKSLSGDWFAAIAIGCTLIGIVGFAYRGASAYRDDAVAAPLETIPKTFLRLPSAIDGQPIGRTLRNVLGPILRLPEPLLSLQLGQDVWRGVDVPVSEGIAEALASDRLVHRIYRDSIGREYVVWVMFWQAGTRMDQHNPTTCWPNRGWTVRSESFVPLALSDGSPLLIAVRDFERKGLSQRIVYWRQESREILHGEQEYRTFEGGTDSYGWIRHRLFGKVAGRLSVLVGTDIDIHSPESSAEVERFTRVLAEEVYESCPWARPEQPAQSVP